MNSRDADDLGQRLAALVEAGELADAHALLVPILAQRTPFALLDRIGRAVGRAPLPAANDFLEAVAADRTMGGWVIVGSALGQQLGRDLAGALERCRADIEDGDAWYVCDILSERVPGPSLVADLEATLPELAPWRESPNRWVRRGVGVAVHFWAKRSRGSPEREAEARRLLAVLEPLLAERELDAVHGIGWGLKTIGKYYPNVLTDWLAQQMARGGRPPRALMLRKAVAYLSGDQRSRVLGHPWP